MVGRCQGRHIWRKLDYRDILCNGNRVLYSRSLIFPVIGKTVSDLFEGPDKKSRDPLLEVCIGLFPAVVYHYWKSGEIIPLNDFISYVFFTPTVEYRLFDHIWFIPPYLIISLCLPFLCRMIRRCNIPFILFSVVLVLLLLFKAYYPELLQTVIVYLFLRYGDCIIRRS